MLQLILVFSVFFDNVVTQELSLTEDIKALSELPLEKLLNIKKSFEFDEEDVSEPVVNSTTGIPQALPLQSKKISKESQVYHYDDSSSKDKSSSIQSIFQISVTTLAFLAFGGYLICLLVQAVKGKNNNYQTTATQIMSAIISQQIRRKRPTSAPYRRKTTTSYSYWKRRPRPKREILTDLDVDSMYYSLINLSEGYTRYHTEDYLRYNFSS
ncbi:uncharacterized protein LOC111691502, partial [Anoplophora glabripennis]|uniref:uncharacterized protein LOC111691502 n=1 Tax=Anoplophora glabripennis TaxID=217634 RepID=UPI000C792F2B